MKVPDGAETPYPVVLIISGFASKDDITVPSSSPNVILFALIALPLFPEIIPPFTITDPLLRKTPQ